ncbi:MAG: RlmE family RNA methyltransferase [Deltaproteobacteria bacterium]|nr:RlmE family RNA methyltransferase [Deltaproteobacteria bacterium]
MEAVYKRKDSYYLQAKKEGFRSRAAYKLTQIVQAERIVRGGDCVLDAGAAPGGWSQVLLPLVGNKGKVAAVDILPMEPLHAENFRFFQDDLSLPSLPARILGFFGRQADVVLSDAAPNTSGIAFTAQARSAALVRAVFSLARKTLKDGGTFLAKIFEGPEADAVFKELQAEFEKVRRIRPAATRKESFELYLLAKGFKSQEGS